MPVQGMMESAKIQTRKIRKSFTRMRKWRLNPLLILVTAVYLLALKTLHQLRSTLFEQPKTGVDPPLIVSSLRFDRPDTSTSTCNSILKLNRSKAGRRQRAQLHVPLSYFSLHQPPPSNVSFDPNAAIETAKAYKDIKFFHECGFDEKRDSRFTQNPSECPDPKLFTTEPRPRNHTRLDRLLHDKGARHASLVAILAAWSRFAETRKIPWLIAHGTLLGWFWGGHLLPWDADLDIQMPTYNLVQLAQFNNTLTDDRFLIEVAPSIYIRSPQASNTIDARVIDTTTGYFMDITGLTQKGGRPTPSCTSDVPPLIDDASRVVGCKSPRDYLYDHIIPLSEAMLEGIKVWRPHDPQCVLRAEFTDAGIRNTLYWVKPLQETYQFDEEKGEWMFLWFDHDGSKGGRREDTAHNFVG
ncbi:LicD family-domain-containing protein [Chytriomyces sp. MP71]|nr:LicD family-domain-containing protein [Chytriomyces sp. MP71]